MLTYNFSKYSTKATYLNNKQIESQKKNTNIILYQFMFKEKLLDIYLGLEFFIWKHVKNTKLFSM